MKPSRTCLVFLLASITSVAIAGQAGTEVPLADFMKHPRFHDIKISPEGDYLAASSVRDGQAILSLIRLADMNGISVRPRDNNEVQNFVWVAPHRLIYTISEKTAGLEAPQSTGELFGVNADGSGRDTLFSSRVQYPTTDVSTATAQLVYPYKAIDGRVLIAKSYWNGSRNGVYPDAQWMNISNGTLSPVTKAPLLNAAFIADNHGEVRFAYAQGMDQMMRVYYREKGGHWELLLDESRKDPVATPLRFNRDDSTVYFDCDGAKGVGGLCAWDVATRKLTPLWSGTVSGVLGLLSRFDDQDIFAIRSMPGITKTTLIGDSAEGALLASLMKQFPDDDVRLTSHTADGKKVVFLVSSDRNPGDFYLYDADTHKATLLFARMPWIKPVQMARLEPITLNARDGLALHGYLTRPADNAQGKNLPLVVYVHGGPYGIRDHWAFEPMAQAMASRGYAVLQVNYRGSGDYGRAFKFAGYHEWGGKMQDDVTDATRWAIAQGIADPQRICIFGGSYGGYAALEGAVKEPDLYRCTIGYVGVYDLQLMYKRGDIPQSTYGKNYLKAALGENETELWSRSPLAHVDSIKAKVMLAVGGADTRVPPEQGERLHNALDKAHIAHEWIYQRTEGHGFYDEANRTDLMTRIIAFLNANIGPAATVK
ncbi:MAG: S9 family peptidase [Rhodanobacter sp.]|jgi:dipeptidyl aminopeptidase/acylaminoacyl peptidase|nr:S9 family peptidase [Rhodanobacter sp.]